MRRSPSVALVLLPAGFAGAAYAAPAARVVVRCRPNPAWCDAVKAEFPKATGIAVRDVRLSAGESLRRVRAKRRNPTFDIWVGGSARPGAA